MDTTGRKFTEGLRIIWAIAAKDILDAVKNRTTLSIIIGVSFLMLSSQALPLLLKLSDKPTMVVYSETKFPLLAELKKSSDLGLRAADSADELERIIGESSGPLLGLIMPADFERRLETGEAVELKGYFVHWVNADEAAQVETFFESKLTELAGRPVQIDTQGQGIYPAPDSGGQPFMVSMSLAVAVITICGAIVPFLMIEEKETHTLDALLVSPAGIGQMVAGKAIAGIFYGLTAAGVVLAFNPRLVVHWEVAVLASVCGAAFAVAVGLLLGSLFDNPQSMNLWFGGVIMVLMIPIFLAETLGSNIPEIVRVVVPWIPSVLLVKTLLISFSGSLPWSQFLSNLGLVSGYTVLILAAVVGTIRRAEK